MTLVSLVAWLALLGLFRLECFVGLDLLVWFDPSYGNTSFLGPKVEMPCSL